MKTYTLEEFAAHVKAGGDVDVDDTKVIAPVQKVEAASEAERTVRFRITTGTLDRANDTLNPKGWDVSAYKKNPVVLWAHSHYDFPVARTIKLTRDKNGMSATAQFVPADTPVVGEKAEGIRLLIKGKFINSASVGFRPKKFSFNTETGGIDFEKQELLEWSFVSVPMLSEALVEQRGLMNDAGMHLDNMMGEWDAPFVEVVDDVQAGAVAFREVTDDELRALCEERGIEVVDEVEVIIDDAGRVHETSDEFRQLSGAMTELRSMVNGLVERETAHAPEPDEEAFFTLLDDEIDDEHIEFDDGELVAAVVASFSAEVKSVVVAETHDAVNRARGRVD